MLLLMAYCQGVTLMQFCLLYAQSAEQGGLLVERCGFHDHVLEIDALFVQEENREAQLPPQERVQAVRPFWETLTQEQRVQLLSLSIEELRAKAADVTARLKRQSGAPAAHTVSQHQDSWSALP